MSDQWKLFMGHRWCIAFALVPSLVCTNCLPASNVRCHSPVTLYSGGGCGQGRRVHCFSCLWADTVYWHVFQLTSCLTDGFRKHAWEFYYFHRMVQEICGNVVKMIWLTLQKSRHFLWHSGKGSKWNPNSMLSWVFGRAWGLNRTPSAFPLKWQGMFDNTIGDKALKILLKERDKP